MAASPMRRDELHHLVDLLPEASLAPVVRLLQRAQDPLLAGLDAAPPDDEPVTEGDLAAITEARAELEAGRVQSVADAFGETEPES